MVHTMNYWLHNALYTYWKNCFNSYIFNNYSQFSKCSIKDILRILWFIAHIKNYELGHEYFVLTCFLRMFLFRIYSASKSYIMK